MFNEQLAQGNSVRLVQLTRTVLSAALTRAMREELVFRNVARLVTLPTWERKDLTPWTAEEARHFLTSAFADRLYAAFLLLIVYGMRRGEVLGLRWCDINWDTNQLHITQQLQQVGNALQVGPVTTNAGKRDLPLLAPVRAALSELQAASEAEDASSDLVFLSTDRTPIWPRNFVNHFHDLRERAGLRRITVHYLRHTAATLLKNLGVPPRDVQLILGHAQITTTLQLYQHGDVAAQQTALDRVGRALLVTADDGTRCRQIQSSTTELVFENASIISGGPGGARTLDTLLKRQVSLGQRDSLTSVVRQLRTRTNTHVLGYVAVKSSRQSTRSRAHSRHCA